MTNKNAKSFQEFGPLSLQLSAGELRDEIGFRLGLLLKDCGAEATPEGWRKLAMYLIARLPEFKFEREHGDESTMHLPLMRIECLIRTNYPVIEMALEEAKQLKLSNADTNTLVNARLADAPELSIARAVRIEAGVDGKKERNWTDKEKSRHETLLREYRKEKNKAELFTSAIRRGAHKSLRAWFAIENAFSRLEIQCKAKDITVNKDDLEPNYD